MKYVLPIFAFIVSLISLSLAIFNYQASKTTPKINSEWEVESVSICGTFEAPGKTPGTITTEEFQMVITKDGATIPEDTIGLRICEEGK